MPTAQGDWTLQFRAGKGGEVARFLLEWSERGGKKKEGIRTILTLTHEEIGQLIGASRETITRILGDFKERHWIVIRGSTLLLQDKAALEGVLGHEALPSSAAHSSRTTEKDDEHLLQAPVSRTFVHPKAYSLGVGSSALRG
ncbi:MAG: helix-turn-helix domain-containing protein [Acidobacteria bacterium]|nr:helix-turn-helix domain-containing protein [Acidobacteriota bacterium]